MEKTDRREEGLRSLSLPSGLRYVRHRDIYARSPAEYHVNIG